MSTGSYIFAREPVRQIITAMNTNNSIFWNKQNEYVSLSEIWVAVDYFEAESLITASTPISTDDNKRIFFNTLTALGLLHCGLRITLDNYQQHFIMCFDLTSTQQAALDFLHPELTNCSVSLELQFSNALTANLEIFVCVGYTLIQCIYYIRPQSHKDVLPILVD